MEQNLSVDVLKQERNYGIELLRIISMILVCFLHVLGQGGVLKNAESQSVNYYIAWFMEIVAFCAVNCYALISGWAGVYSKYRFSNIIYIWLQVFFYSIGITLIFIIFKIEPLNGETILHSFFPVAFNSYWYFTAYFCLFLFIPILNAALNNIPGKYISILLLIILVVVSILSLIDGNIFQLNEGYGVLWLIILYLTGGVIRKHNVLKRIKTKWLILIWVGMILLTFLIKLSVEQITMKNGNITEVFSSYTHPSMIIISIVMLELFSRITFKKKPKLIAFFAPTSFGVYIIHVHPFMWKYLNNVFAKYAMFNPFLLILSVIGTALALYIGCSIIDYLRSLLFKVIRLKPGLQKLEEAIKKKILKDN
ncbi:MAG: acyltransferase [Clostridia bacterium]|nr:acyltransferase [Clostridia bacterium]